MIVCVSKRCSIGWNLSSSRYSMMPASDIGEGHHEGEGVLIHPPYQGDCGRHGTEEQRVTSGGLTEAALAAATRILER